jgi:hypothetical protein
VLVVDHGGLHSQQCPDDEVLQVVASAVASFVHLPLCIMSCPLPHLLTSLTVALAHAARTWMLWNNSLVASTPWRVFIKVRRLRIDHFMP